MTSLPPRVDLLLLRMQAIVERFGAASGGSDFRTVLRDALGAGSGNAPLGPEGGLGELVRGAAREAGIDADLLLAVVLSESGGNPRAVSPAGASGLMQLMPDTARELGVSDVFDPVENLRAGARYLRAKLSEFGGDLGLALAAYNAGSGAVHRWGGIPPYEETREYVARVLAAYHRLRAEDHGVSHGDPGSASPGQGPQRPGDRRDASAPLPWLPPRVPEVGQLAPAPRGAEVGGEPSGQDAPPASRPALGAGPVLPPQSAPKPPGPPRALEAPSGSVDPPLPGRPGGEGGSAPPSVPHVSSEARGPGGLSFGPGPATVQVLSAGSGGSEPHDQDRPDHLPESGHGGARASGFLPGSLPGPTLHEDAQDPGPLPSGPAVPERPGTPQGPSPQIRLLVASQDLGRVAVRLAETPGGVAAHVVASDRAGALLAWRASDLREALQGYGVPLASLMIARAEGSLESPWGPPGERVPGEAPRPRARAAAFTLDP